MDLNSSYFVLISQDVPVDTQSWESNRESYEDASYSATLQDAVARARATDKLADYTSETRMWVDNITVDADLDAWRREMARRTEMLLAN